MPRTLQDAIEPDGPIPIRRVPLGLEDVARIEADVANLSKLELCGRNTDIDTEPELAAELTDPSPDVLLDWCWPIVHRNDDGVGLAVRETLGLDDEVDAVIGFALARTERMVIVRRVVRWSRTDRDL